MAMRDVEVARSEWPGYFAALSAQSAGARASVRVMGVAPNACGERPAGWVLHACAYDAGRDLLQLELSATVCEDPGLRFFVARPREILARSSHGERAILILDSDAVQTLVRLRPLPPRRRRVSSHTRGPERTARPAAAGGAR